jgi:site-specific DNA recombinase
MRAAIYCRVSTEAQEAEGTSLKTQLEACQKHCQSKGYDLTYQFSEAYSGLSLERPKLNELRNLVRANEIDAVIVYCLDRLSRDPVHGVILTEELEKHHVALEAVTETVDSSDLGKLMTYIRGYAAKLEAEKIRERTIRGRKARAQSGKIPNGGTGRLYGYYYVRGKGQGQGVRIENPDESKWVKEMFRWYVTDGLSVDGIAQRLRSLDVPAPSGKGLWQPCSIHKMLKNEAYTGTTYAFRMTYGEPNYRLTADVKHKRTHRIARPRDQWIELPNATPPIISREVFQIAQERFQRNKELASRCRKEGYLLSGYIKCGRCGRAYWGCIKRSRGRKTVLKFYHCSGKYERLTPLLCDNQNLNAQWLEKVVWAEVEKVILKPEIVIAQVEAASKAANSADSLAQKLDRIDTQLKHLAKRQARISLVFQYSGDESQLKTDMAAVKAERERLLAEKANIEALMANQNEVEEQKLGMVAFCDLLKSKLGLVQGNLATFSLAERRLALESLRIRVTVDGYTVNIKGLIPSANTNVAYTPSGWG